MNRVQFNSFQEAKIYFEKQGQEQYRSLTVRDLGEGLRSLVTLRKDGKCEAHEFLSLNPEILVDMLSKSAKAAQVYQSLQGLIRPLRKEVKYLASSSKEQVAAQTAAKEALASSSQEHSEVIASLEGRVEQLTKEKESEAAKFAKSEGDVSLFKDKIGTLQNAVVNLGVDKKTLAKEIDGLQKSLKKEIQDLTDKNRGIEQAAQTQAEKSQKIIESLTKELEALKETLALQEVSLEGTHFEKEEAEEKLAALQKTIEKLGKDCEALRAENNSLKFVMEANDGMKQKAVLLLDGVMHSLQEENSSLKAEMQKNAEINQENVAKLKAEIEAKDGIIARLDYLLKLCLSCLKGLANLLGIQFNDITPETVESLSEAAQKNARLADIEKGRRQRQKERQKAEVASRAEAREKEEQKVEQARQEKKAEEDKIAQEKALKLAEEQTAARKENEERKEALKEILKGLSYAEALKATLPQPVGLKEKEEIIDELSLVIEDPATGPSLAILTGLAQVVVEDLSQIQQVDGAKKEESNAPNPVKGDESIFAKKRKRSDVKKRIEARNAKEAEAAQKAMLFPQELPSPIKIETDRNGEPFVKQNGQWVPLEEVLTPPAKSWFSWIWN